MVNPAALEREQRWDWRTKERLDPHLRSSRAVTGCHIQSTDGNLDHVEGLLADGQSCATGYMIVETSHWWAGKKVLVASAWIERVDWEQARVRVTVTPAQIEHSPGCDPAWPVERAHQTPLHGHYRQPACWSE